MDLKEIFKNGGATINKKGNVINLKTGYMISEPVFEEVVNANIEIPKFEMLLRRKLETVKMIKNGYIGIWINDHKIYVDISKRVVNKKEALRLGKWKKQKAVWDNKKGMEILL